MKRLNIQNSPPLRLCSWNNQWVKKMFSRHFCRVLLANIGMLLLLSSLLKTDAYSMTTTGSTLADGLVAAHPRLFIHDSELTLIKQKIATDPFVKSQYEDLLSLSESLLLVAPDKYVLLGPDRTLIPVAREVEKRIFTLAGIYRLTKDRRFAERGIQEMLSAAAFPDWNPQHFLDTAELTAALGVGYDWLYPVLSPQERATIKEAIITKGITPWIVRIHANQVHFRNNWSQVCNGGETVGALALAERGRSEDLARAEEVVEHARSSMTEIMQLFAPDGGFEEGPVYWNYATIYNVLYIAALDSSIGTDFDAANATGFAETGEYRIQSIGPLHLYANFGDAQPPAFPAPQMFWFAQRFHQPEYAAQERQLDLALHGNISEPAARESIRFAIFGLFWSALEPAAEANAPLPRAKSFARISQAYLRSAWNDPQAWFIGFKGGDAHASHGHLDLGSFVLDGLGERWAVDLASDSYGLPGYFGKQRWDYYRTRTEGHNTLTVNGQNEDLDAVSPLMTTKDGGSKLFSIADLDRVFKGTLRTWKRGVAILDGQRVLVQDEVQPAEAVNLDWNLHTRAIVELAQDGRSATLTRGERSIEIRILAPANCFFSTASTAVPLPQSDNPGVTNLVIRQTNVSGAETIAVVFSRQGDNKPVPLKALTAW